MTRNISKEAAAQRLYKLAAVARVIQRAKSAGCCGRKRSSGKRRKVKRSSLNKEASRDLMRKIACAVAVIQRTRGLQKTAGDTPIYKNPIAIGGVGGGVLGGTLGAILGPKGQKFLSGLAGAGIGAGVGVGAGYGYTKLKKKPEEEKKEEVVAMTPATGQQGLVQSVVETAGKAVSKAKAKAKQTRDTLVANGMSRREANALMKKDPGLAAVMASGGENVAPYELGYAPYDSRVQSRIPGGDKLEEVSQADIDLFGIPQSFYGYKKVKRDDGLGFNIIDSDGRVLHSIDDAGDRR